MAYQGTPCLLAISHRGAVSLLLVELVRHAESESKTEDGAADAKPKEDLSRAGPLLK